MTCGGLILDGYVATVFDDDQLCGAMSYAVVSTRSVQSERSFLKKQEARSLIFPIASR